jgi:nitrogenase molybdenum-iron protein alpha chain
MPEVNLKVPAVAVREIRLSTITGYEGTAEHLVHQSRCGALGE